MHADLSGFPAQHRLLAGDAPVIAGQRAAFAEPTEYVRRMLPVTHGGAPAEDAWSYLYNWPVTRLPRIASGKFLET